MYVKRICSGSCGPASTSPFSLVGGDNFFSQLLRMMLAENIDLSALSWNSLTHGHAPFPGRPWSNGWKSYKGPALASRWTTLKERPRFRALLSSGKPFVVPALRSNISVCRCASCSSVTRADSKSTPQCTSNTLMSNSDSAFWGNYNRFVH